jgi:hypothetical protein
MKSKAGRNFKERFVARREARRTRRIELATKRHGPMDYGPERGGMKESRGGAGGGGTGGVGAG